MASRHCRVLWLFVVLSSFAVFGVPPEAARAQPSANWRDYSFIGLCRLDVEADYNLEGNAAVVHDDATCPVTGGFDPGRLDLRRDSVHLARVPAPYLAGPNIVLGNNARAVDLYRISLQQQPTSQVTGVDTGSYPFPLPIDFSGPQAMLAGAFTVANDCTNDLPTIPSNGSGTINPGTYCDMRANQNSTVTLAGPGNFYFRKMDINRGVVVTATGGPVNVFVRRNVKVSQFVTMVPSSGNPDDLAFWVGSDNGTSSDFLRNAVFTGTFYDPNNNKLSFGKELTFEGTAVAIFVELDVQHEGRPCACGDGELGASNCQTPPSQSNETCDPPGLPGDPLDATSNLCRNECNFCGDGIEQPGERCDDGNRSNDDPGVACGVSCRNDCTRCGDGVVDAQHGEMCDDGNCDDGDGCSSTCTTIEVCGDGIVQAPETCDPSGSMVAPTSGGAADRVCRAMGNPNGPACSYCGDGVVDSGELCDDGNGVDGDLCRNDCTRCGDGVRQLGEECDPGDPNATPVIPPAPDNPAGTCLATCALESFCGNGAVDRPGETCDPPLATVAPILGGPANRTCRDTGDPDGPECTFCGDGVANSGEGCDDGNSNDGDLCRNDCTRCGDGVRQPGEECDPGDPTANPLIPPAIDNPVGEVCQLDCTATRSCGDGILQSPEETCERPGDLVAAVGGGAEDRVCRDLTTSKPCTFCGDGINDGLAFGEACDDGNDVNEGNGVSGQCRNDCSRCGDSVVQSQFGEVCDPPGSITPNGVCRADCSTLSIMVLCGDGEVQGSEKCDPGNPNANPPIPPAPGHLNDADSPFDDCRTLLEVPPCTFCGDGVQQFGEDCDPADPNGPANCPENCTFCGNGVVDAGELCDDGNSDDDDECRNNCTPRFCGDGELRDPEHCDPGNVDGGIPPASDNPTDMCRALDEEAPCTYCGDGAVQSQVESCDDGNDVNEPNGAPDQCRTDCSFCGDGLVQPGFEVCDDGNDVDDDDCNNECLRPFCGDGILQDGEACDPGPDGLLMAPNGAVCRADCTYCGDGLRQDEEACDDGNDINEVNGDPSQCRNNCTFCGDGGEPQIQFGEQCDPPGSVSQGFVCTQACLISQTPCFGDPFACPRKHPWGRDSGFLGNVNLPRNPGRIQPSMRLPLPGRRG